jgi:elongation factor P--(R)-beta-lysine ligase
MLDATRRFFAERSVLEVDTPLLSGAAVSDPHIESIAASLTAGRGRPYFLQTSPEHFMKRLLCAGFPDIYQVCNAFRDGEGGRRHQPEFTLIEWYRHDFGLRQIMEECADLISTLLEPRLITSPPLFVAYTAAFETFAGANPQLATTEVLANVAEADARMIASLGDERDAWLDLVLSLRVVPRLETGRLTVLHHYPASQAALARLCPDDSSVADRFEIFFGDLELANGFVELQDAGEQLRRFEQDQATRRHRGQTARPLDQHLIAALDHGLPKCAGVAVGLDRLLMINEMSQDIRRVQSFCFEEEDHE